MDYKYTNDSQITPVFHVIQPRAGVKKKKKRDNQQFFRPTDASCYLEVLGWFESESCFQFKGVVWSFWWNNVCVLFYFIFYPSVPMTQGVLWALSVLMPFQEIEGKHFSFLPNDHICSSTSLVAVPQLANRGQCVTVAASIPARPLRLFSSFFRPFYFYFYFNTSKNDFFVSPLTFFLTWSSQCSPLFSLFFTSHHLILLLFWK